MWVSVGGVRGRGRGVERGILRRTILLGLQNAFAQVRRGAQPRHKDGTEIVQTVHGNGHREVVPTPHIRSAKQTPQHGLHHRVRPPQGVVTKPKEERTAEKSERHPGDRVQQMVNQTTEKKFLGDGRTATGGKGGGHGGDHVAVPTEQAEGEELRVTVQGFEESAREAIHDQSYDQHDASRRTCEHHRIVVEIQRAGTEQVDVEQLADPKGEEGEDSLTREEEQHVGSVDVGWGEVFPDGDDGPFFLFCGWLELDYHAWTDVALAVDRAFVEGAVGTTAATELERTALRKRTAKKEQNKRSHCTHRTNQFKFCES